MIKKALLEALILLMEQNNYDQFSNFKTYFKSEIWKAGKKKEKIVLHKGKMNGISTPIMKTAK
jgi:hypothetical protein